MKIKKINFSINFTGVEEYLAESGDADEDLALLHDIPSLPRLLWKLPCNELDNGPGEAGEAIKGDFDLTESALDLQLQSKNLKKKFFNISLFQMKMISI